MSLSVCAVVLAVTIPHSTAAAVAPAQLDESRWAERELDGSPYILRDPVVTEFIASVSRRVCVGIPGTAGGARIYDSPDAFSFALPTGGVYISGGLLLRVASENDVATLIARECAAVALEASARSDRVRTDVWLLFLRFERVPLLPNLWAPATIRGAAEEAERAVDRRALQLLANAGYDGATASSLFRRLARDASRVSSSQHFYAVDRAGMKQRADHWASLVADHGPDTGNAGVPMPAALARIAERQYAVLVRFGRERDAIALLENERRTEMLGSAGEFWLGEAYRRRASRGDFELADAAYRRAMTREPADRRAIAALGRMQVAKGNRQDALALFRRYVALAPDALDHTAIQAEIALLSESPP
ncbi:MAG: hypothetical protein JSR73_08075 [Proteobacteria bacterium]|nr:hypothetical protein [Pseudomonadota bacterium]